MAILAARGCPSTARRTTSQGDWRAAQGITLFQGDGAEASHDNLVVNNTVYDPTGTRAALQVADGADNNIVFNNILYAGSGAGLEIQSVSGLVHDYNLVSSYDGGSAAEHESSPAGARLFVDAAGDDYALAQDSAALDTGVATLAGNNAPNTDIDGNSRPAGASIDRGCYEAGATGGTTGGGTTDGSDTSGGATDSGNSGATDSGSGSPTPDTAKSGGGDVSGGAVYGVGGCKAGTGAPWVGLALVALLLRRGRRAKA